MPNQKSMQPSSMMRSLEERILFDAVCEDCLPVPADSEFELPVAVEHLPQASIQNALPTELVIVDGNVENGDELVATFMETSRDTNLEFILLDSDSNGVDQITDILSDSGQQYQAIHILSHGQNAEVQLGNSWLSQENLKEHSNKIASWGDSLGSDGDLLFYGCELAGSQQGVEFLETIQLLTGADVAASDDLTGNSTQGGDWELEFSAGAVESVALSAASYSGVLGPGEIGGTVLDVTNSNGAGVANVSVSIFDDDNQMVGSAVTASDGVYLVSGLTDGQDYRVVFTDIPDGFESGAVDSTNNSSVVFAAAGGSSIDFSVHLPEAFCESNPQLATTCYIQGTHDGQASAEAAIVTVENDFNNSSSINVLATIGQIGSTFGLASQQDSEIIYAASFLKRNSGFGPAGMDAIYLIDSANGGYANSANAALPIAINLSDFGIDVGTELSGSGRGLSADPSELVLDQWGWDNQFRLGIGDIEISDDGNTLYVMNLNDHDGDGVNGQLVILDITDPGNISLKGTVSVTNEIQGVADSDIRPFALSYNGGEVYIGVTGTAESTQDRADLKAAVYVLDSSQTSFSLVAIDSSHVYGDGFDAGPTDHIALDYERSQAYELGPDVQSANFQPWTNDASNYDDTSFLSRPQPLLTDIEFDDQGSMILAIANRDAYQLGDFDIFPGSNGQTRPGLIAGELLMVANTGSGFELEGDVAAPSNASGSTNLGPGGGEYFFRDNFNSLHNETAMGALAVLPGSGEVVVTMVDPLAVHSGGLGRLSTATGGNRQDIELYNLSLNGSSAKGAGLGDLEVICEAAPIEIGNFIWFDADKDGIQDAGEQALENVLVGLFDDTGQLIATVETDANGQYLFSSAAGTNTNSDGDGIDEMAYGLDICAVGCEYSVGVLDSNYDAGGALAGMTKTTSNVLGTSNSQLDHSDSDAVAIDVGTGSNRSTSGLLLVTGGAGANNHTFDFGFVLEPIIVIPDPIDDTTAGQPVDTTPVVIVNPIVPPICCEAPSTIYSGLAVPETLSLRSNAPVQGGYDVMTPEAEPIACCTFVEEVNCPTEEVTIECGAIPIEISCETINSEAVMVDLEEVETNESPPQGVAPEVESGEMLDNPDFMLDIEDVPAAKLFLPNVKRMLTNWNWNWTNG